MNEEMTLDDLETIDTYSEQCLRSLQQYGSMLPDEEFEATVEEYFTTVLSNGVQVPLCANGETKKVTKQNLNEFIELVLKIRFNEAHEQVTAIQDGIRMVLKDLTIMQLMDWQAMEARCCGEKTINVDRLKSITSYPYCSDDHRIIPRFWRVFDRFTEEEKSLYLKFVWGRSRLPMDLTNLSYKHEVRLFPEMNN